MKKTKTLLLGVTLSAFMFSASAQNGSDNQTQSSTSQAGKNWFISLGAAGNLLQGEQDHKKGVGDRITFGGEFSVGKWFNPNFGMRFQLNGGNLRGFNFDKDLGGVYTREDRSQSPDPITPLSELEDVNHAEGTGFWQDFSYSEMTIDLMANLTHLMRGHYKENTLVDVIPFVGFGYMHGISSKTNPVFDGLVGKIGTRVAFNINPQWAVYLEPQASFTSEQFDGYIGDRGFDNVLNVMVGAQFSINKDFSAMQGLSMDEVNSLNSRINDQHRMIENQQNILERQQQMIGDLERKSTSTSYVREPQPTVSMNSAKGHGYLPDYIRFGLNSSALELVEKTKVEDAAAYLKANADSKLLLIGYADKKTGNSSANYELSKQRAQSVATELTRLGISSNRLIIKWMGDKEQPYDQNEWNRVVIMVER